MGASEGDSVHVRVPTSVPGGSSGVNGELENNQNLIFFRNLTALKFPAQFAEFVKIESNMCMTPHKANILSLPDHHSEASGG